MRNQLMWSIYSVSLGLGHRWAHSVYRHGRYDLICDPDLDAIEDLAKQDDKMSPVKGIWRPAIEEVDGYWTWTYVSPANRVSIFAEQRQDCVKTWLRIQRPHQHDIRLSLHIDDGLYTQALVEADGGFESRHAKLFREIFCSIDFYLRPRLDYLSSQTVSMLYYLTDNPNIIWGSSGIFIPMDKYYLDEPAFRGRFLWVHGAYTKIVSETSFVIVEDDDEYAVKWER